MDLIHHLDKLMPDYLSDTQKSRLRDGLKQFNDDSVINKNYTHFYSQRKNEIFLQGDLIKQLRFPSFNYDDGSYKKRYFDAVIISNTCDIDGANKTSIPKNVLLAKAIPLNEYISELENIGISNLSDKIRHLKNQMFSNLLYLPVTKSSIEYVVLLDDISQVSKDELNQLVGDIESNRIEALDYFGYYLFIFKLSYHLCRMPQEDYRK